MKDLKPLHKLIFFLNNIFALLFLASFVIPYVTPESFPLLSVLSLAVPLIVFIHIGFVLYWWLVGFKRQFLLSFLCLLLAVGFSYFPYKFKDHTVVSGNSISVMSYNVRIFNRYDWIEDPEVPNRISRFVRDHDPDILALQEYAPLKEIASEYDYKYEEVKDLEDIKVIGHITEASKGKYMITRDNTEIELQAQGWNPLKDNEQ